ncbi:MAG: alcohol dehydrogenase [Deltaproteobacteria bacterium]|nr:MAG: alcohol dehydrogenase [Deltaproteobacteria bacterium]
MKAAFIEEHGGLEKVKVGEVPVPEIGPDDVLVRVKTAALNHLDIFVRNGLPGVKLTFPHILGSDGAGIVEKVGENVKNVSVGDEVVLNPGINCGTCEFCLKGEHSLCVTFHLLGEHINGTYAEFVRAPAINCYPRPKTLTWEESSAFPLTFLTAWRMLVTKARIKPGEWILIIGIGGGVAVASLQISKLFGLKAIVTSGSDEKLARAKEMGADFTINHNETDFAKEVRKITEKRGVDVVFDSVGKATWKKSLAALAKGGRLVTCGATTGPNPETDVARIFWNQLTIYGSTMGTHAEFREMLKIFEEGKVKPVIDSVFPLDQVPEAQKRMEEKKQFGKIVVKVSE